MSFLKLHTGNLELANLTQKSQNLGAQFPYLRLVRQATEKFGFSFYVSELYRPHRQDVRDNIPDVWLTRNLQT